MPQVRRKGTSSLFMSWRTFRRNYHCTCARNYHPSAPFECDRDSNSRCSKCNDHFDSRIGSASHRKQLVVCVERNFFFHLNFHTIKTHVPDSPSPLFTCFSSRGFDAGQLSEMASAAAATAAKVVQNVPPPASAAADGKSESPETTTEKCISATMMFHTTSERCSSLAVSILGNLNHSFFLSLSLFLTNSLFFQYFRKIRLCVSLRVLPQWILHAALYKKMFPYRRCSDFIRSRYTYSLFDLL